MAAVRKKGRGGGSGKTEALPPGETPSISPPLVNPVKEGDKRPAPQSLTALVSQSFQRDRGERPLPESIRNPLSDSGPRISVRLSRHKKSEPNSSENTPRLKDLIRSGAKNEEKEKKFYEAVQKTASSKCRSSCKGNEGQTISNFSCKAVGDEKLAHKSLRWGFVEEKLMHCTALKEEDRGHEHSRRSTPRASSVNVLREGRLSAGGLARSSKGEDRCQSSKTSPTSVDLASQLRGGRSVSPFELFRNEALQSNFPVKSMCSCGSGRSSVVTSPLHEALGCIDEEDKNHFKVFPFSAGDRSHPIVSPPTEIAGLEHSNLRFTDRMAHDGSQNLYPRPSFTQCMSNDDRNRGPELLGSYQNNLQGRLALLEGRVSQMAAELRETKNMLDANNPICSKALLTDIQSKISNIEKVMTGSRVGATAFPPPHEGRSLQDRVLSGRESSRGSNDLDYSGYHIGSPRLAACDVFDGQDGNERPYPHHKLTKQGPSLHQKLIENRAALHEKLKQNRELLRTKLAALGGKRLESSTCDEGAMVAAEFFTSLDDGHKQGIQRAKDFAQDMMEKNICPGKLSSAVSSNGTGIMQGFTEHSSAGGSESSSRDLFSEGSFYLKGIQEHSQNQDPRNSTHLHCETGGQRSLEDLKQVNDSGNGQTRAPDEVDRAERAPVSSIYFSDSLTCGESPLSDYRTDEDYCLPIGPQETLIEGGEETIDDTPGKRLCPVGQKTATAGWFVCEGEGLLLAHDDGCCSFYDVANMEEKAEYKGPKDLAAGIWEDCWVIRAAGIDGRSNKYVVAASAGGAVNSAFCSWDFHNRSITAYHCDVPPSPAPLGGLTLQSPDSSIPGYAGISSSRDPGPNHSSKRWFDRSNTFNLGRLGVLSNKKTLRRTMSLDTPSLNRSPVREAKEAPLWWYRPCGALLASVGSSLTTVSLYDIRDGEAVMRWETKKAVTAMESCSPLQWRTRGKMVVAEDEGLSFWDVNGMNGHRLHHANLVGKQLRALHVHNVDAECSGGVRQKLSSSEHHTDGVLCTHEAVNILDFRVPTGIAMKIPTFGEEIHSVFANGDSVFAGVTSFKSKQQSEDSNSSVENAYSKASITSCKVNQWSIRQGKPMNVYTLPDSNQHPQSFISQVWGSIGTVIAANENALFVFDEAKGYISGKEGTEVRSVIADDLYYPTFDYASSRVLLISRDQPAQWCHWP